MPGRTKDALRDVAQRIDLEKEWRMYEEHDKSGILWSYSYSLETHVYYNAKNANDRINLLNLYSDGNNPINMIAINDVINDTPTFTDISETAYEVIERGFVPFIGCWQTPGAVYTGVSIAANHGISDPEVMAILKQHRQLCAARIFADRTLLFP